MRDRFAALIVLVVMCSFAGPSRAALTAYYDFEGNFNDFPGAGVFADDLMTTGPGAMIVSDPATSGSGFAKGSTMSYTFDNDASDSRLRTGAWSADLTSTDQYTIMYWFKGDDDLQDLNNTRLATVRYNAANQSTSSQGSNIGWQVEGFGQGSPNGMDLRIQGGAAGNFFSPDATGVLGDNGVAADDVWHHVAFVVANQGGPGGDAYMETFVDGVSRGTSTNAGVTGTSLLANQAGVLILGGHNVQGRSATGFMDDFALFDEVLSGADILTIAQGARSPADFLPGGPPMTGPAPVAHWRLDDAPGSSIAIDSSGRGHDGTAGGGVTFGGSGVAATAADFDGSGAAIDANMGADWVTGDGARTILAWFNADTFTGNQRGIVGNGHNSGNLTRFDINTEVVGGANSIMFRYQGGNIAWSGTSQFGDDLDTDTWYHLAVVVPEGATVGDVDLYINGTLLSADGGSMALLSSPLNTGGNLLIGDTAGLFDGSIDDVQYYNLALDADQINTLFNNPGLSLDQIGGAIPEPGTAVLALLGAVGLAGRRGRAGRG